MISQNNIFGAKRNVDIVFCIDGTGSMSPCIESVKNNAKRFYADFAKAMTDMGSEIDMMRIKVIVFRDYKCDGQNSMVESPFYELPDEEREFSAYLDGIRATGGCGEDANGLEALYRAMKSDFTTGAKDRQIIVLFADTTAIPLGARKNCAGYPSDMVDDNGLLETWMCMQNHTSKLRERNKRLVMFAPKRSCYEEMKQRYNRSIFEPVKIHSGLDGISFADIIKIIAASASSVS
ncbi:MAG: VWA domain-containing protein [Muribaculaceae bacterium]|nr:VWA domain-containing protein [Muribaculaceae bacterium]MCM1440497.1 VWA domain-containing protein [Roseburia sp.]